MLQDFKVRPAAVSAKLEGVDDRNAAELLQGVDVAVTREDLGETESKASSTGWTWWGSRW